MPNLRNAEGLCLPDNVHDLGSATHGCLCHHERGTGPMTPHVRLSVTVAVRVPDGWTPIAESRSGLALDLTGPAPTDLAARLQVMVTAIEPDPIQVVSLGMLEEISRCLPDRVLASCDLWPHPEWGMGRLIQTGHVDSTGRVMGHDTYLFVDGDLRVTIDVDYALEDLLSLEDDIAAIVASARLVPA